MYMHYPQNRAWSFYVQRLIDESAQGAADFNECYRTLERIPDGDREAWFAQWTRTAEAVERLGSEAVRGGHAISARDHFFRAFTYYRTAQFYLDHQDERKDATFNKSMACFQKGSSSGPSFFSKVEVPFEGIRLPAYFCAAAGSSGGRKPAVVFIGGADTFAEQLLFMGARKITERGMHCLTLTGPGQGAMRVQGVYARSDFEKPLGAVIDLLQGRDDVDPRKIAIIGVSLGGYYAARAASVEERVAACVLFGACYSVIDDIYDFYPTLRHALQGIVGAGTPEEARARLEKFTLAGVIQGMSCPLLVCHGADDYVVSVSAAHRTYNEACCVKELRIWDAEEGGAGHCMVDNRSQAFAFMFDWLADRLMGDAKRS